MHTELKQMISKALDARAELEQKLVEKAWEDETFKQELINNPKAVINRETRQQLPEELEIVVLQETANKAYLIFPENPAQTGTQVELSEKDLERIAGGVDVCLIVTSYSDCIDGTEWSGAQGLV